jgi:phosphatidylserine/phosphatidylglycerophosphate/cardiolipin synthase-like enzyme
LRHLETPDASEGQIASDTIGVLGQDVVEHARIYVWPLEKRLPAADGRHGSLHAKVALADGRIMLVSSANLTEYAMTLNMEMGLLLHGGPLPGQVERHLVRLVQQGVFQTSGSQSCGVEAR